MNKYAALGLLLDAAQGKRVAVISRSLGQGRQAMRDFEVPLADGWQTRRANGNERIDSPAGGVIRFCSTQGLIGLRGTSYDVVFVDTDAVDVLYDETLRDLHQTLRPGGVIVRA